MADPSAFTPVAETPPTVVQGVRAITSTTPRRNEVPQVQKGLIWHVPNVAPFVRLTSKLKKAKTVENFAFYWQEKQPLPRSCAIAALTGSSPNITAIEVATEAIAGRFQVGDIVLNSATNACAIVTAVDTSTKVLTVTPIGEEIPSLGWTVADVIVRLNTSFTDGDGSPESLSVLEDGIGNYCQIIKNSTEETGRFQNTEFFEGDASANLRKECEMIHLQDIEMAYLFGKPSATSVTAKGGKIRSTMKGVDSFITTNRVDCTGSAGLISKGFFDDVMKYVMRFGPSGYDNGEGKAHKVAFASMLWISALSKNTDDKITITEPSEDTFGLRLRTLQGPWGELTLMNAPILNRTEFQDRMFVLDMECIRPVKYKGRGNSTWKPNVQDNDADLEKGMYLADVSIQVEIEKAHAAFYGLGLA